MPIVANIVGARPQFIKAGPVSRALDGAGVEELLINTGQHYDSLLTDRIMVDVGLREPDIDLGIGSASHATQTARILAAIEGVLVEHQPAAALIYGDTNSTIAGALAATKLGIPTAHVEAGLRSFNRTMPEELNRVITDRISDVLAAPTDVAVRNLANEGLGDRTVLTGDVMVDALQSIEFERVEVQPWAKGHYYVATIHRAANTDDPGRLRTIVAALGKLDHPVHVLAHPRLRSSLERFEIEVAPPILVHDPLPYAPMLKTVKGSYGVITDSGGLQKEAFILGAKCITMREETEWPETLEGGWNVLADPEADLVRLSHREVTTVSGTPFGAGDAALHVVSTLTRLFD